MSMQSLVSRDLLRFALTADAIATGATALAFGVLATPLGAWTNIPSWLLFWAGITLVPWVAFVALLSRRPHIPAVDSWTVIIGNALWAVASVALVFSDLIQPNTLGVALIVAQALVVAAFAELQFTALRRSPVAVS